MEQRTPIPLRQISVATNFVAHSNDPSRAYCPPSGGAGFRVEQGTGLPTCGWSTRRNFQDRIETTRTCAHGARLGKSLSVMRRTLATSWSRRKMRLETEGHFSRRTMRANAQVNSHASQLTRRVQFRLQQAASRPSPGSEGAKRRDGSDLASTLLASLREQTTPIAQLP